MANETERERLWLVILRYLRENGWSVAIHNDYRQDGQSRTFWLLVDGEGWTVKGEGHTEAEAFQEIYEKLPEVDQRAIQELRQ